jgi:hypothetical protein
MNVFACLVHENPECVMDLVRNLRHLDQGSQILLYDGSRSGAILRSGLQFAAYGAVLFPTPKPQEWGRLHGYALDCMEYALEHWPFETLTIVDSDQLAMRAGYSGHLKQFLAGRDRVGMLGNSPSVIRVPGDNGPARCALHEIVLWRSFLNRFPDGESKFPMWTFWPSSVFTVQAARELVKIFRRDGQLKDLLARTQIFATEEVFLPTLTALLGFEIAASPCSYDYVKYRAPFTLRDAEHALARNDVFWMHSVPRLVNDPLRRRIRERFNQYSRARKIELELPAMQQEAAPMESYAGKVVLSLPILQKMRNVRGWLEDEEADLLIGSLSQAFSSLPPEAAVVEVGSFEGKATLVLASVAKALHVKLKVYAIDPHDGKVGALDTGLQFYRNTLETLQRNVALSGVSEIVEVIPKVSVEVEWDHPIGFLLIDHLHDYASVARDFHHFERWLVPGGYVAFHDYADYFPGVRRFVDELLALGDYSRVHCVKTMMVLKRNATQDMPQPVEIDKHRMREIEATTSPSLIAKPALIPSAALLSAAEEEPLVSCLMPTANRRPFIAQAIYYFQRQRYRNRELIVVDDGEDAVADLIPDDPAIRYVRVDKRVTIGAKHNLACSMASGEICLHWDDDDWMADWRVAYQVRELQRHPVMTLSGLDRLYFYEPARDRAWEYQYGSRTPKWVSGATFCYRKQFWENHPFPEMNEGGDTLYVWSFKGRNIAALADHTFYVATVHAHNTSRKQTESSGWCPIPSHRIQRMLDQESWDFYRTVGNEEAAVIRSAVSL